MKAWNLRKYGNWYSTTEAVDIHGATPMSYPCHRNFILSISRSILLKCQRYLSLEAKGEREGEGGWASFTVNTLS
jgi:hypothetical protein